MMFCLAVACSGVPHHADSGVVRVDRVDVLVPVAGQSRWQNVALPENFTKYLDLPPRYSGSITLRFALPAQLIAEARSGRPLALDAGLVSDVSRFFVVVDGDWRFFGGLGSMQPYEPGAMRPFLRTIPSAHLTIEETGRVDAGEVYLVVHLATREGRYPLQVMEPFRVGPVDAVYRDFFVRETIALGFIILYVLAGAYHLFLGLKRPQENYNLYFALFALIISCYWFVANTATRDLVFGDAVLLNRKTEYVLLFFIVPPFLSFFSRYFYRPYFAYLGRAAFVFSALLAVLTVAGSVHVMRWCGFVWHVAFLILVPYFLYHVVRQAIWRNRDAYVLIFGILLLTAGGVNDVLTSLSILHTPRVASYAMFVFTAGLVVLMANRFAGAANRVERLLAHTSRLNLELIKKNIHPHFLMNSVNAAQLLVYEDPDRAVSMLQALADELRETLKHADRTLASLSGEIELCRNHLRIMSLRKDRRFDFEVRGDPAGLFIPPLILLTLVENGLTHGFRERGEGRFVLAVGRDYRRGLVLELWNDGDPEARSDSGTGTGLKYVESRLGESYGGEWKFEHGPADGGYRARLVLPWS